MRASGAGEGTPLHANAYAQWFFVLGGETEVRFEGRPPQRVAPGDEMALPAGEQHALGPYTDDFALFSLSFPVLA